MTLIQQSSQRVKIKRAIRRNTWSLVHFATIAGVPYRTVHRFVTGSDVRPATLARMMDAVKEGKKR